jgi:hypothetical protein
VLDGVLSTSPQAIRAIDNIGRGHVAVFANDSFDRDYSVYASIYGVDGIEWRERAKEHTPSQDASNGGIISAG